jgi:uncharacterized membrane protein
MNPLREHALGVGIALLLIIVGIILIVAAVVTNGFGNVATIKSYSVTPTSPALASSFTYNYVEYGPLCNVTIPPVQPLSQCQLGVLFNITGVGHAEVTGLPLWVTLQPPSIAQHYLIYNFTVVLRILNVNGYPTNYMYTFTASVGKYTFYQPNGAYIIADMSESYSSFTVYVPSAQAVVYVVGLGGFPLTYSTANLECGTHSWWFTSLVPELVSQPIPMPNGTATSIPCTLYISVPVFPGKVQIYKVPLNLAIGENTYTVEVPVSGIYVPGYGYLGTLPDILIWIGFALIIIGVVVLLIEFYHWRRARLAKAYGIPPYYL